MAHQNDLPQLEKRLRMHVETLAHGPRLPGTAGHRDAEDYIAHHLQGADFAVEEATSSEDGFPCTNLIARLLPEPPRLPLFVVGAHYDTAPGGTPGADDNASAVAALLELARWLAPKLRSASPVCKLQLVAYDLEEFGYLGSSLHCREIKRAGQSLRGMISLEMLGYTDHRPGGQRLPQHLAGLYPDVGNFIGICGNENSRELVEVVTAGMKTVQGLPVEWLAVPGNGEALPQVRLSDHSPFWDSGYQALMITDTAFMRNPHYHQETDTPETLDYPFLAKVTAGVCEAVGRIVSGSSSV